MGAIALTEVRWCPFREQFYCVPGGITEVLLLPLR
jgi:hypothetical protein